MSVSKKTYTTRSSDTLCYSYVKKKENILFWEQIAKVTTVKLGDKERFDKEQISVKEPFPVTKCQFTS
jgi:hypothetical protein